MGTATAIALRRAAAADAASASAGATNPLRLPAQAPTPAQPAQPAPQPRHRGSAASCLIRPTLTQAKGTTFAVNMLISGAQNVYSVPLQVNYDPKVLQVVNVSNGGFLSQDGQTVALVHREDETTRHAADHRHASSGRRRRFRAGLGSDSDIHGEGQRPVHADHLERRSARSRHAGHAGGWRGGHGHGAVEFRLCGFRLCGLGVKLFAAKIAEDVKPESESLVPH